MAHRVISRQRSIGRFRGRSGHNVAAAYSAANANIRLRVDPDNPYWMGVHPKLSGGGEAVKPVIFPPCGFITAAIFPFPPLQNGHKLRISRQLGAVCLPP
jgi:hypothetical protein